MSIKEEKLMSSEFYLRGFEAGKQKMIEDEIEFLEQLNKLVVWHQSRSLLPYDWFDYEGKRINQRLEELKSQVSNHSSPLIKEDEKPKTGEKSPVHAKKQLEK